MGEKTIVLNIPILEDENRNEYSYLDLVEAHLNSKSKSPILTDNTDAKLEDLAKALERKYGQMLTINKKGKKKRVRVDDFIDYGDGYDSQDSFIDDSEAIDLIVVPTMSTKYGGFFINNGILDSIEDQNTHIEAPPEVQKKVETKKDKRHALKKDKSKQLLERAVKQLASPAAAVAVQKNNLHNLDSTLDAVLAQLPDETKETANGMPSPVKLSATDNPPATAAVTKPAPKPQFTGPCVLPRLPEHLLSIVQHILTFKPTFPTTGKWSLPPQFDTALLRFDSQIVEARLHKSVRSGVYAYLEETFGLKRKSIMTRLRKLREVKDESKLEPMLVALKCAVSKVMPDILNAYKRDMASYQERLSAWEIDKASNSELKRPGAPKKIFKWTSDCRILIDRIVAFRMETAFAAIGKCVEEDQMKRFLNTLIPLWPDNWISIAALWRASLPTYHRVKSKIAPNAPVSAAQSATTTSVNEKVTATNVYTQSPVKPTAPTSEVPAASKPLATPTSLISNRTIPLSNERHKNPSPVITTTSTNSKIYSNVFKVFAKSPKNSVITPTIDLTSDVDMPVKTAPQKTLLPPISSFSPPSISSVVRSPVSVAINSHLLTPKTPQERRGSIAPMDKSGFYSTHTPVVGNTGRISLTTTSSCTTTPSSSASPSDVVMQQIANATGIPMATVAALGNTPGSIQAMMALYQQQQQKQQQQQQQQQAQQQSQRNRLSDQHNQQQKQHQFIARAQNNQQQQPVSPPPPQQQSWSPQQIQALRAVLTQQQVQKQQQVAAAVSIASQSTFATQNPTSYQATAAQLRQVQQQQQQMMQHQQVNQSHYQNVRRIQLQPNLQMNSPKDGNRSINRNGK